MTTNGNNYLLANQNMIAEQYELYTADIETYAPYDEERAGFWYGGFLEIDPLDELQCGTQLFGFQEPTIFDNEIDFADAFLARKDDQKIKVIVFHNSSYDMGYIAEILRRQFDYVQNPEYPQDKMIYGGDKEQVWEIYESIDSQPIIVIDSVPILSGQSLRKLMQSVCTSADEEAFLKGTTPIVDKWRKPTEEDMVYLKHDIVGLARVLNYYDGWKSILTSKLTNASQTQAEFKSQEIDGVVLKTNTKRLSPRFKRTYKHSTPVPKAVTDAKRGLYDALIERAQCSIQVGVDKKKTDYFGGLTTSFRSHAKKKCHNYVVSIAKERLGDTLKELDKCYLECFDKIDSELQLRGVISPFKRKKLIQDGMFPNDIDKALIKEYGDIMKAYKAIPFSLSDEERETFLEKQNKAIQKEREKFVMACVNEEIRPALRGGMTYLNPKYKDKIIGRGCCLDINSMYPSILLECEIPYRFVGCTGLFLKDSSAYQIENYKLDEIKEYAVPFTEFVELNRNKYYVVEILELEATTKKGCVPCLKRNTAYAPQDRTYDEHIHWVSEIKKGVSNTLLCSVDIDMLFKFYDVKKFVYNKVYYFEADDNYTKRIREHIKYWGHKKETATNKADRQYAKIMLNSLWGYWCMSDKVVKERGKKKNVGIIDTNLISGIYTTAYSRYKLASMMNALYDNLVYTDTDSVHIVFGGKILGTENVKQILGDMIDDVVLGKWAYESEFEKARYVKPKTYIHYNEKDMSNGEVKEYEIKSAGADLSKELITYNGVERLPDLENFRIGATYKTKKALLNEKGQKIITDVIGHI